MPNNNNFQDWQLSIEANHQLPTDLEHKILHQRDSLSHFASVVEVFVPNALQIAVDMVSGRQHPNQGGSPNSIPPHGQPNWKMPILPPSGPELPIDILSRFTRYENIRTEE